MKAAVCYEYGKPLVIEELDIAAPEAGEVKVKMTAAAICHSDVHIISGDWGTRLPLVPGHEGAGVVVEVGPEVDRVQVGDAVVVSLLRECGNCPGCAANAPHLCSGRFPMDTNGRLRNQNGDRILAGLNTGAFAEYVVVSQTQLVPYSVNMSAEAAALLACGVITGVGAVNNSADVEAGKSVVVIGAGGVGLNSIQGAKLRGADPIIALDLQDAKADIARDFGATHFVNASADDVKKQIRRLTGGGADYTFVTVGSRAAAELGYSLTGLRGTLTYVGIPDWKSTVPVPVGLTILAEKKIAGSFMGSTNLKDDVPMLIEQYSQGELKLDELITNRYSLEQINEAIAGTKSGTVLRNVIMFE